MCDSFKVYHFCGGRPLWILASGAKKKNPLSWHTGWNVTRTEEAAYKLGKV